MQRVWQLAMLVGLLMRWVRSQGRQLELLCCLEEAARRRHLALLVLRLVRREHLRWLREWQLERPWSEAVPVQVGPPSFEFMFQGVGGGAAGASGN